MDVAGGVRLLPSQRASLYAAIEAAKLDPSLFKLHEPKKGPIAIVMVRDFGFFFEVSSQPAVPFLARFTPSAPQDAAVVLGPCATWGVVRSRYSAWLQLVHSEISCGNPWAELERQSLELSFAPDKTDSAQPFTAAEFEKVDVAVSALRDELLRLVGEDMAQRKVVTDGIRQLLGAAKSQDRKQFFYAAVGFVMSTAVSLALAPEQTRRLFELLKTGLSTVIRLVAASHT